MKYQGVFYFALGINMVSGKREIAKFWENTSFENYSAVCHRKVICKIRV